MQRFIGMDYERGLRMLKEWIDENLPGLVEELVAREITRIATRQD